MRRGTGPGVMLALLLACGGGDGGIDEDATCGLSGSLSGDVTATLVPDELACLIQVSFAAGVDVEYADLEHPDRRVALAVADITKGETGSFAAALTVTDVGAMRSWTSDGCTVAVEVHELVETTASGEQYRVRGAGECAGPAVDDGGGSVTITPFEFVVVVPWAG